MEIVNVVVSGSFNQKIDLNELFILGDAYSYDPDIYHGAYIKLKSARVTIYKTGKYIIPGIKSLNLIDEIWHELILLLDSYLDTKLFEPPVVKNIVAKGDVNMPLPLAKIQEVLRAEGSEYEPEVFPGLMWSTEYGATNIFQNGKFMLLGSKTFDDLLKFNQYVTDRLLEIMDMINKKRNNPV